MPRLASPLRTIRVALLICGELPQTLVASHGDFHAIYQRWLKNSLPRYPGTRLVMHGYDVARMKYPKESQLSKYDAVMLTGSPSDAWADEPWVNRLVSFVRHVGDEHPHVKIYGICFGHQIVNRALGGTAQRNTKGWELGRTTVHTTDVGKMLFGVDKLELQQIHQDHVPISSFPSSLSSNGVYPLGYTDNTDNHGLVKFHSQSPNFTNYSNRHSSHLARQIHVMTVQGHPEFNDTLVADITKELHDVDLNVIDLRKQCSSEVEDPSHDTSRIDGNEVLEASKRDDGIDVVGRAFWRLFGVEGGNIRKRRFNIP